MNTYIAEHAISAIYSELHTTPKPGLIDLNNNGSHKDMDVELFYKSAESIKPYIKIAAQIGLENDDEKKIFSLLKKEAILAEQSMLTATDGVNTHKGTIFTIGIFTAAAGTCYRCNSTFDYDVIRDVIKKMCSNLTNELKSPTPKTYGEILFSKYGLTGARGQAQNGYAEVFDIGLPAILYAVKNKISNPYCFALYRIISTLDDTNIVGRGGIKKLFFAKEIATLTLNRAFCPYDENFLVNIDKIFIQKNISPGGAADLLAASIFLYTIKTHKMKG